MNLKLPHMQLHFFFGVSIARHPPGPVINDRNNIRCNVCLFPSIGIPVSIVLQPCLHTFIGHYALLIMKLIYCTCRQWTWTMNCKSMEQFIHYVQHVWSISALLPVWDNSIRNKATQKAAHSLKWFISLNSSIECGHLCVECFLCWVLRLSVWSHAAGRKCILSVAVLSAPSYSPPLYCFPLSQCY